MTEEKKSRKWLLHLLIVYLEWGLLSISLLACSYGILGESFWALIPVSLIILILLHIFIGSKAINGIPAPGKQFRAAARILFFFIYPALAYAIYVSVYPLFRFDWNIVGHGPIGLIARISLIGASILMIACTAVFCRWHMTIKS